MAKKPISELAAGQAFYAERLPELDVEYFATMWHFFTVGHLVVTDLDRIARQFGYSFADIHFLGSVGIARDRKVRNTDMASTLYVSNAVISTRVTRLEKAGLLERQRSARDRRAYELSLTPAGRALIEDAILAIARDAKIVRYFRKLSPDDRSELSRLLGALHERFDREFVGVPHSDD